MNWLTPRLLALMEVIHSPELAFARHLGGPSYLVPLCVLGVLFVALSSAQAPLHVHWMQYQMEEAGAPPDQVAQQLALIHRSHRFAPVVVPLLLLLRWAAFAFLLRLTSQLFLEELAFQRLLGIVAYSYLPILVRDATILLVLFLRGEQALENANGLNVAVGLNLLLPSIPLPWSALAGNVNIFEAWYVILLVVGLSKRMECRWQRAAAIVLPNWVFTVLIQFGVVSLFQQFLNP